MIAAVATPAASCPGPIGTPSQCATYSATARFIAGLVARKIATATGSTIPAVAGATPIASDPFSIAGKDASELCVLIAIPCAGATALAKARIGTPPNTRATA